MPYAILRFAKKKFGGVAACYAYNERKKEKAIPILTQAASWTITTLFCPSRPTAAKRSA